jgi:hypothetical protein
VLVALEAAAWGIAAGAAAALVAFIVGSSSTLAFTLAALAGVGAGLVWFALARHRAGSPAVIAWLERAQPAFRNLLITSSELQAARLRTNAWIHERVLADAAAVSRDVDPRAVWPITVLWRPIAIACAASLVSLTGIGLFHARPDGRAGARKLQDGGGTVQPAAGTLHVTATIVPLIYLCRPRVVDHAAAQAIEGSTLRCPSRRLPIASPSITTARRSSRDASAHSSADRRRSDGLPRRTPAAAPDARCPRRRPDALPSVKITTPGRDRLRRRQPRITFTAEATDDLGLRSIALRFTKVSGSGEQFAFPRRHPLAIVRNGARVARRGERRSRRTISRGRHARIEPSPPAGPATHKPDAFFIGSEDRRRG